MPSVNSPFYHPYLFNVIHLSSGTSIGTSEVDAALQILNRISTKWTVSKETRNNCYNQKSRDICTHNFAKSQIYYHSYSIFFFLATHKLKTKIKINSFPTIPRYLFFYVLFIYFFYFSFPLFSSLSRARNSQCNVGNIQHHLINRKCIALALLKSSRMRVHREPAKDCQSITIRGLRLRHYVDGERWPPSMCHRRSCCSHRVILCALLAWARNDAEEFHSVQQVWEINSITWQCDIVCAARASV